MARTVLITGAGRGLGLALAACAAARGDRVVAGVREPSAAAALGGIGPGTVEVVTLDVTDPDSLGRVAARLAGRPVDLLVCNAGALIGRGGIADPAYDAAAFATVLAANVAGPFFTVRAFLPHLRAARGRAAIITSVMGVSARPRGDAYLYRASKAAATNLAANLAVELKPMGVAVGAWHPGWVRTDMGGQGAELSARDSAEGLMARFDALTLARTGVVEDWRGQPLPF